MSLIGNALDAAANYSEKAALRGEVAFERWYYHYQPEAATRELGQLLSRVWALAYAIESLVKVIIVTLSILAYVYMGNELEIERRCEVLKAQGSSLLYSVHAVLIPEIARDAFKEANTWKEASRRFVLLASNYTLYCDNITLKMLINTH
ncbi:MAG: hypothetical protein LBC45_02135 [Chlamydiales bacterium]|jgi:hypothetical protein|nr:hypothetical protein [Chlamydiales bacterium]